MFPARSADSSAMRGFAREPKGEPGTGLRRLAAGLGAMLVMAAVAASAAEAQRRVEVHPVQSRVAAELQPIAQAILGPEGSATVDPGTNALVLIGEPGAVAEALAVLERQDRRPRTIVLRYDTRRIAELEALGFDVRWTAETGNLRIGNVRRPPGSGASVDVRTRESMKRWTESFRGTMRVSEGATTRIETGTRVPYTTVGRSGPNTEFVDATTGFEASARVLADGRIEVDLASFAGRALVRSGQIARTDASTRVWLTPGETAVIGGLDQAREGQGTETLGGARRTSGSDDTVLMLRAEIE